jgi:hypothetical protein
MVSRDQQADVGAPRADETESEPNAGGAAADSMNLGASTDAMLAALFEAAPETVDHLLKAAQELLLAAKAVVDAGERAVEAHRSGSDAAERAAGEDHPAGGGRVRRIDLA